MHPKIASFLADHLLEERPALRMLWRGAPNISFAAPKFNEATNAPEESRTPSIEVLFAKTPAPQYPHRMRKANNEQNRVTPEIRTRDFFCIKRGSF